MATKTKSKVDTEQSEGQRLATEWDQAWDSLAPLRSTWDEKEQALLAQTNDSVSGNITATRVTDAALSTLAFERQARVSAQLPTGRVYALSKADDKKAKILNIVLNRYILPNANSQFDMLIKIRLWGVYASVYGSMPMMYDYRVDDAYIGPDAWLIDPRKFALTAGYYDVQGAPAAYVMTEMSRDQLERILERKTTSYDKAAIKKLLATTEKGSGAPSSQNNASKTNTTVSARYDESGVVDKFDIVCKYEDDAWTNFAIDYPDIPPIRKMTNPHNSGRKPVVMRHCFPILNSVFGLGDYERGMKVQKAKDSILNLFLEGAKMRVYPALKMIDNQLTPSTIRYQAGTKWKVKRMDAVEAMNFGSAPLSEFQNTFAALSSIQQNQFGTSTTEINEEQGGPTAGRTPQALKMQKARENARDTWDRFMGEKATEELLEGMLNLLHVKMEKPIDFTVFESDIQALGYVAEQNEIKSADGSRILQPGSKEQKVDGLDVFDGAKAGTMRLSKKDLFSDKGYSYQIDSNSTMKQDDEEQFSALMATWEVMHTTQGLAEALANLGVEYDEADHLKKIFIAAGISDWEKILKELSPEKVAQMKQQQEQQKQQEAATMAKMMGQQPPGMGMPGQPPGIPGQMGPMVQPAVQPQPAMPMGPQMQGMPQFVDPQIAQAAAMMLGGR